MRLGVLGVFRLIDAFEAEPISVLIVIDDPFDRGDIRD